MNGGCAEFDGREGLEDDGNHISVLDTTTDTICVGAELGKSTEMVGDSASVRQLESAQAFNGETFQNLRGTIEFGE
jgi:hypothetical protein